MKKILNVSVMMLSFFAIESAQAAGYQLNEYSATGMGRSFAGAGVVGDDFSAIGFNPAGMQLNASNGLQLGASMVSLYSEYKGTSDGVYGTGNTRITRVLPSGFAQYKLTPDLTFGLGVYVPFGLATDYDNGWFGESHGGLSQITNINISPAVSYQVMDMITLGASVNVQHAKARITSAADSLDPYTGLSGRSARDLQGDDWGVGYTLGALITPMKGTRLGVSYRSKVSHELKGKIKISGAPGVLGSVTNGKHDILAKIETPEVVLISAAQDIGQKWTVSATARWTRWSRFENLDIIMNDQSLALAGLPAGTPVSQTHEHWKDTWFYALGLDYKHSENWAFRLGAAYDQSVIRSAQYRTVRIPDGRRIWTSLGLSYTTGNWQFDAAYAHLFVKTAWANHGETGKTAPNIKYASDANMVSAGIQYKF